MDERARLDGAAEASCGLAQGVGQGEKAAPAAGKPAGTKRPCVLVGVTGCIAAYKACEVVRGLQKAGVRAKVVMTEHATEFVGPTTFRALTHEPVAVGLFDEPGDPIHHVSLAQECDAFVIAPCTANVAAKLACGLADDLLTTTALATTAPLVVAPAMNVHMHENAATQENLRVLAARGVTLVEAEEGYLACGDVGKGRLADVDAIVAAALRAAGVRRDLEGRHVLVTAGPTEEPLDPVRCLTNRSSGKTGYAIARAAVRRGARVTLVSGPVALEAPAGRAGGARAHGPRHAGRRRRGVPPGRHCRVLRGRGRHAPGARGAPQAEEGPRRRRPGERQAGAEPRRAGHVRGAQAFRPGGRRVRRRKPTTWWRTPARSWRPSMPTSWWPTT